MSYKLQTTKLATMDYAISNGDISKLLLVMTLLFSMDETRMSWSCLNKLKAVIEHHSSESRTPFKEARKGRGDSKISKEVYI